jgi:hypothetical protein
VSPFAGGGVAYSISGPETCNGPSTWWASRDGKVLATKGTKAEHMQPAAWMPDGTLALVDSRPGCTGLEGDLYTLREAKLTKVAGRVSAVSARASFPPPPPQPKDIPSRAPA